MPNVPYPYEVNWQLVKGNGSLTPICSLSKHYLLPSLTVLISRLGHEKGNFVECHILYSMQWKNTWFKKDSTKS